MATTITRTADATPSDGNDVGVDYFYDIDIGEEHSDRIVVAAVMAIKSINSCSIDYGSGNVSMTAGNQGYFYTYYTRVFYLAVPTGTSADFTVTHDGTSSLTTTQIHMVVYDVAGAIVSSSGSDGSTDMDATDPLTTGSITIPTDGGFLGSVIGSYNNSAKTWSNATEDRDLGSGSFRYSTATRTTSGTVTITCTGPSNAEDGGLSYIILAPAPLPISFPLNLILPKRFRTHLVR